MSEPSRAVLVSIDGLRPDAIAAAHCPHLDGLVAAGASSLSATTVMPSVTLPVHVSMFHSVPPDRHGNLTNDWHPMARPVPGLFDVAHAAGLRTASVYNWEQLRDLSRPGSLDFAYYWYNYYEPEGDAYIVGQAVHHFGLVKPALMFVYFGAVDQWGHDHGWMSPAYLEQVGRADAALGVLLAGLPGGVTVLVLSDHGGHGRNHGLEIPEDMTIPWIIAGPGVRRGHTIASPVSVLDTAPTWRTCWAWPHRAPGRAVWSTRCSLEPPSTYRTAPRFFNAVADRIAGGGRHPEAGSHVHQGALAYSGRRISAG